MKFKPLKFEKLISNKEHFEKTLVKTRKEYRPFDPGQYIYNLLLEKRKKIDIFSDEYLELVYMTLIAWNMNGRGAKLNYFYNFKESIKKNKDKINSLKEYRIENLSQEDINKFKEVTKELFDSLELVGILKGNKIKSKLVTFSKTLHFLLPNLYVPIDRKYTLDFFYSTENLPTDSNIKKNNEKQIKVFNELFDKFHELATTYNLKEYVNNKWNANIPKIIDNSIIGYGKLKESELENETKKENKF